MAINEAAGKFARCQEACLERLRLAHPTMLGHRKVAISLMDPQRGVGTGVSETYCDEMTRRALNRLEEEGRVVSRLNRYAGLRMKVFGVAPAPVAP